MYPMKLRGALKEYLWGGERLKAEYNKETSLKKVAESWELSCHKDGKSIIENGEYAGKSLLEYIEEVGKGILGTDCERFENFPIMIKLIDAKDNLSVQVHPKNEYALEHEGEYGKTEMWYIVDCDEGASLLYGFKHKLDKSEFEERIKNNTLLEVTNEVKVKKGEVYFIEAGTLHAIGRGILIAEIQQNSNTTYRIYDYGRVGADNKPRELHIEKAVDVTELTPPKCYKKSEVIKHSGYTEEPLSSCEYFTVNAIEVETSAEIEVDDKSFCSLLCLEGSFSLTSSNGDIAFKKGESLFLQADFGKCQINGKGKIIKTTV